MFYIFTVTAMFIKSLQQIAMIYFGNDCVRLHILNEPYVCISIYCIVVYTYEKYEPYYLWSYDGR